MKIQCPSCRFERDVPDSSLRPGKTYKVTCPRCSAMFHFSRPEPEEFVIEPEETAVQAPAESAASVSPVPAEEKAGASEKPSDSAEASKSVSEERENATEQNEEEALPSGAVIPEFTREDEKPEAGPEKLVEPEGDGQDDQKAREEEGPEEFHEGSSGRGGGMPAGAPWESPEYYGFLGSFTRTLLGVLFHAPEFFRHVKCRFSVIRPILFYVLLSVFQVLCARLWSIKALRELSATATDPQTLAMAEQLMQSMNMPLMLLITPFFSIMQAVFLAGIYHLMIRMVQPDRADFATTLRVVCYSAAPLVLCIVPMFGSVIATGWSVLCVFIGCRYALRLSWLRTVLALLPLYILELAVVSQIPAFLGV